MLDLEELGRRIVAAVGSIKDGCTETDLTHVFKNFYGKELNPKDYGFADLKSLLNSAEMKDRLVCRGRRYFAAEGNDGLTKLLELVRNTKSRKKARPSKGIDHSVPNVSANTNFHFPNRSHLRRPAVPRKTTVTKQQQQKQKPQPFAPDKVVKLAVPPSLKGNAAPSAGCSSSSIMDNKSNWVLGQSYHMSNRNRCSVVDGQQSCGQSMNFKTSQQTSGRCHLSYPRYQSDVYDSYSAPSSSFFEFSPQTRKIQTAKGSGLMKSQKGRKRLVKLIEQGGDEMSFSELKVAYERQFQIPLDDTEICRIFGATKVEVENLYEFLKSRFKNYVQVMKQGNGDLYLTIIDEEDNIEEFENLNVLDHPFRRISSLQDCYSTSSSNNCWIRNEHLPAISNNRRNANDRLSNWRSKSVASAVRSKDDYLSYKALGDKLVTFIRAKGSFKVHDLSKIFYEEDGCYINPRNYPERTWEKVIEKVLLAGGHPELILQDGILSTRKVVEKAELPFKSMAFKQINNIQNSTVPVAMLCDLLKKAGRPLSQNELCEQLSAKGIKINASELVMEVITTHKDVFCCEFDPGGASISLNCDTGKAEISTASSFLPLLEKSIRINTHIMSDYCSVEDSAHDLFKPIVLLNVELIDETLGRLRIQVSFRLCAHEQLYNFLKEKMNYHYRSYGQDTNYMVDKPVKNDNYIFYDAANKGAYRVQCLSDAGSSTNVHVYFIDEVRCDEVPVLQLKKLIHEFAKPAYGIVAQTAPFTVTPGREDEFRSSFAYVRSKLLQISKESVQIDVHSEPSEKLFELKQLYTEAHDGLKVPAKFLRENLITIAGL